MDQNRVIAKAVELDEVDNLIAYEQGELNDEETIALFQRLVDSGLAWSLQGSYGRTAQALIDAGKVHINLHDAKARRISKYAANLRRYYAGIDRQHMDKLQAEVEAKEHP